MSESMVLLQLGSVVMCIADVATVGVIEPWALKSKVTAHPALPLTGPEVSVPAPADHCSKRAGSVSHVRALPLPHTQKIRTH